MEMSVSFNITHRNSDELERELLFAEVMRLREIAVKQANLLRNIGEEMEELFQKSDYDKNNLSGLVMYAAEIQKYLLGDYGKSWRNA
jgi:hypothetical protein